MGEGKFRRMVQGITAGCLRISAISAPGSGLRKGMAQLVCHWSPPPAPGLLLLGCDSPLARAWLSLSWFSCFPPRQDSEPVEVTQGQEEANTSQSISSQFPFQMLLLLPGFRSSFCHLWPQHTANPLSCGIWQGGHR